MGEVVVVVESCRYVAYVVCVKVCAGKKGVWVCSVVWGWNKAVAMAAELGNVNNSFPLGLLPVWVLSHNNNNTIHTCLFSSGRTVTVITQFIFSSFVITVPGNSLGFTPNSLSLPSTQSPTWEVSLPTHPVTCLPVPSSLLHCNNSCWGKREDTLHTHIGSGTAVPTHLVVCNNDNLVGGSYRHTLYCIGMGWLTLF